MAPVTNLTDFLNNLADYGVFAYLIPFLLIYAVVFGILQKSHIFGDETKSKGVNTIVGLAVAGLAIQFDYVSTFFAEIFPKFGVALAIFIVLVILIGFFYKPEKEGAKNQGPFVAVAWVLGVLVVAWALSDWNFAGSSIGVWWYVREYFWVAIVLIAIIGVISTVNGKKASE